jgi:IclR family transcriptional regulator, acetate operon repressor
VDGDFRTPERAGGVQSVERALLLLELMADAGGEVALTQLAESSALPLPTIHRIIRTLTNAGYVRQQPSRRYALGPRLIRLGETAGRMSGAWARPYLADVTAAVGETSSMAVLDGDHMVYVAQVPSSHSMRTFTEVGRRVAAYGSTIGRAALAGLSTPTVDQTLSRAGPRWNPDTLLADLAAVRARGYAEDDGTEEVGVRCLAVPIVGGPAPAAISISGPVPRMSRITVDDVVPLLRATAARLAAELDVNRH